MGCSSASDEAVTEGGSGNGTGGGVVQERLLGFSASFADSEGKAAARATRSIGNIGDGEFTNSDLRHTGFGVYCWYTGTTTFDNFVSHSHIKDYTDKVLMLNQQVYDTNPEAENANWTYEPPKYWPLKDDEKLTFRAYAPYVSYQLQTDEHGMPMLPVVVTKNDFHNGIQHDPLWGTSKHGGTDGEETTYGVLYDNYTYEMSGAETSKDAYDGKIYWYFHHGMAKLMFTISVIQDPGCDSVQIDSIKIENLYTQGLLSLSSGTTSSTDKPDWAQRSGDMTVTLTQNKTKKTEPGDLAPIPQPDPKPENYIPYPFVIKTSTTEATPYIQLIKKGLLVIPRDYLSEGLAVTVYYTVDNAYSDILTATGTIKKVIEGNTSYELGLSLTPSTRGLEINLVQSAFTSWTDGGTIERTEYNW